MLIADSGLIGRYGGRRCKASPSVRLETIHIRHSRYRIGLPTISDSDSHNVAPLYLSIDRSSHLAFAHTHTLSLSLLTLSSVTYLFTLTLQWTPPIASQVRRPLTHKPNISVPHAPFHTARRSLQPRHFVFDSGTASFLLAKLSNLICLVRVPSSLQCYHPHSVVFRHLYLTTSFPRFDSFPILSLPYLRPKYSLCI